MILASGSPRRIHLFRHLGVEFSVRVPREYQHPRNSDSPAVLAERLAVYKALQFRDGDIVVAADTLVAKNGKIFPKPASKEEAVRHLLELRGGTHEVITAVAILMSDRLLVAHERSMVVMRNLTDEEIARYVDSGEPMDKAGAYGIQDEMRPVMTFEGCFQNVVGLPLCTVNRLLRELGISTKPTPPPECELCVRIKELST